MTMLRTAAMLAILLLLTTLRTGATAMPASGVMGAAESASVGPFVAAGDSIFTDPAALFDRHLHTTRVGMGILGGWALANIAVGLAGRARTTGTTRYFHEMNAGWNLVNLGIAGFSLMGQQGMAFESAAQAFTEAQRLDMLLLLNTGLDAAYITAGGYLIERGRRTDSQRLQGYGRSLILQGAFLLVFDLGLFAVHRETTRDLQDLLSSVSIHPSAAHVHIPGAMGQDPSLGAIPMLTMTIRP